MVPELVPGSVESTAPVRRACLAAADFLAAAARHWIAIGADPTVSTPTIVEPGARGRFRGYGADVRVALSDTAEDDPAELPLPALIAGWLRERAAATAVQVRLLAPGTGVEDCVRAGAELAELDGELGLLVLGDGSHRHGPRSPGGQDDRAAGFDEVAGRALGTADTATLLALDSESAAELGAQGRVPWQVLAAFADGFRWRTELLYSGAPFGVGYHVATWERR
ncbi:class III extradiol dioxygenase subunit B-like domain-containing protein [Amycolatopsis cihanbeyliensis]